MAEQRDQPWDADYVVIGSGFGGSVSALRLAEKGYRTLVLERGRRWHARDFPTTNWNARRFLWAPRLFCYGFQAITFLRDVMVLHGAGVGGGSLVYANTLLVPPDEVFENPVWRRLGDWRADLASHYATAKRMLGVTRTAVQGETDRMLRRIAGSMGREHTFHEADVGVFFGEPGRPVADPYFGGAGPARSGCVFCGGCMGGCRHDAKNTLDKNYLYFAERRGAVVAPDTEVTRVTPHPEGGYVVSTRRVSGFLRHPRRDYRCRGVVFAGGVLGTVPLLTRCRDSGALPALSSRLGTFVRTNSEALVGARRLEATADYSHGIAIASGFMPDDVSHVEMVRYGAGQDSMGLLSTLLVGGGPPWPRVVRWLGAILRRPLSFLRALWPIGFAKQTGILLFMQPLENHMRLVLRRRWWWPWTRNIDSEWDGSAAAVPKYFPLANDVAERLAREMGGTAMSVLPEVLFDLTSTAHILGGVPMGEGPADGVIDSKGRVHGYPNMYVCDGSIVPVNLSVNPSLTITALSEWVMSHVPPKENR